MGVLLDDLDGHEGYAIRGPRAAAIGQVAACECGWRGTVRHALDEDGYDAALDEWEAEHARPLQAVAIPAHVSEAVAEVRDAIAELLRDRPIAGLRALRGLAEWADHLVATQQRGPRPRTPGTGRSLHR